MEPELFQDQSVDEVLEEVDWEKLGVEGVEDETGPSVAAKAEPSLPAKVEPSPPAYVQLFHRGPDIEIVRRWFGWQTLLMTAVVVFWDLVTFWTLGGIIEDNLLLSLLPVAGGVLGTYYVIARWLNRTRIVVCRDTITVRHGPLPWIGNKEVQASNLKQVYRVEKEHRSSRGRNVFYEVYTLTQDGRTVKLLDGLTGLTNEQALFIAQQIENYLGIQHGPAEGGLFGWLH